MLTTGDGSSGYAEVTEIGWSDTMNTLPDHQDHFEDHTRCLTGSQCGSSRTGVMCSLQLIPDAIRDPGP